VKKTKFKVGDKVKLIEPGIMTDEQGITKNGTYTIAKVTTVGTAKEEMLCLQEQEYSGIYLLAGRFEPASRPKKKKAKKANSKKEQRKEITNLLDLADEVFDTIDNLLYELLKIVNKG